MTTQDVIFYTALVFVITPVLTIAVVWAGEKAVRYWISIRTMRKLNKHLNELSESLARRAEQDKEVKP